MNVHTKTIQLRGTKGRKFLKPKIIVILDKVFDTPSLKSRMVQTEHRHVITALVVSNVFATAD